MSVNVDVEFPALDALRDSTRIQSIIQICNESGNCKTNNKQFQSKLTDAIQQILNEIRRENELKIRVIQLENEKLNWSKQPSNNKPQSKQEKVLIVESKADKDNGLICVDELEKIVKENIDARKNKIKINRITKSKNKVIVSTTEQQYETVKSILTESIQDKCIVREPIEIIPPIIIKNADSEVPKDDIRQAIIEQNSDLFENIEEKEINIHVDWEFKKPGSVTKNVVLKTDGRTRRILLKAEQIHIGNMVSWVDHYVSIMQCSKCCAFGHKHHKDKPNKCCKRLAKCLYCALDHEPDSCPKKNQKDQLKCVNCAKHNNDGLPNEQFNCNHKATDKQCPIYKSKQDQLRAKLDSQ